VKKNSVATLLAQAGHCLDPATGAVTPPIHTATTYARDDQYALRHGRSYSRDENPGYVAIEELMVALERGAASMLFASGMAAIAAVLDSVPAGRHLVAPKTMYYGAQEWMRRMAAQRNIGLTLFDVANPEGLANAIVKGQTDMVWIESPVNPTWEVIDIAAAAEVAHAAGASLVVDSTVAPPVTTRPLELGADLVVHAATKYLGGHSDVLAGIVTTAFTDARWREIAQIRAGGGAVLGPFEAWLLLRGMRTLAIRFERSSSNALTMAQHFDGHPSLKRVLYPGLKSHPGHDIARRQMRHGFGGMLSVCLRGGAQAAIQTAKRLRLFIPATSLGGVESLVEHRASVEGANSCVPENLLRFSIGIESVDELIADLEQAL